MSRKHVMALKNISKPVKLLLGITLWLVVISTLHFNINFENTNRRIIKIGYMPVITNLAAPLLDFASKNRQGVRFKAIKYASFAEMAESLRNKKIDVAFMIAPLSIVLRQQGEDIKVVYIGNRHESTLVTRNDLNAKSINDLVGKTIAVPMRYSGHNISILDLINKHNLNGQINVVEMNPPDMAAALSSGSLDAYYVGEPFAAQTLKNGQSSRLFYVEEVWNRFICNLAVVRNDLIKEDAEVVNKIVTAAIRSGLWAKNHPDKAIDVAIQYWNQPRDVLNYAFNTPQNRILYDAYMPRYSEMQEMADLMVKYNLSKSADIEGLVDDSFARHADTSNISDINSILE